MIEERTATRSIIVERLMPHPPEKVWRALTQSELITEWLMKNDFAPRLGARFTFEAKPMGDWNGVVECEIMVFEPPRRLVYSWKGGSTANAAYGSALDSVVIWTLTPKDGGTLLRMEHAGFGPRNAVAYDTMSSGWSHIVEKLESLIARLA